MTDNETIDDTSSQLSLLKRLAHGFLRVILWLIVIAAVIGALVYLYYMYQEQKELTYMTSDKCSTHDYQTQICEMDNGSLYLRRIEIDNNRMSISAIVDDAAWDSYQYGYWAFWFERCEEGVEIATDMSFSSGEPIMLVCDTQPNKYLNQSNLSRIQRGLSIAVPASIDIDSNGFVINHDYSNTDYSALLRRYALTATEVKKDRELRLKKEAQEALVQLEKEAKEARVQLEKEAKEEKATKKRRVEKEKARMEREDKKAKAKKECEQDNQAAQLTHENTFVLARKTLEQAAVGVRARLSTLSAWCTRDPYESNWDGRYTRKKFLACNDLRLVFRNTTDYKISSIRVGWDNKGSCQSRPHNNSQMYNLESGDTESLDTYLFYVRMQDAYNIDRRTFCMKVSDVNLVPKTFVPKEC